MNVSNLPAMASTNRVIEVGEYTIEGVLKARAKATYPIVECPPEIPMSNGTACIACKPEDYYDLKSRTCLNASWATNIDAIVA